MIHRFPPSQRREAGAFLDALEAAQESGKPINGLLVDTFKWTVEEGDVLKVEVRYRPHMPPKPWRSWERDRETLRQIARRARRKVARTGTRGRHGARPVA